MIFNTYVYSCEVIDVRTDVVIDDMPGVQLGVTIDEFTDVSTNVLEVAMTTLQFPMSARLEESMSFC